MKSAVFSGSFDPITKGHLDVISRAAGIFDRVYVLVLSNTEKRGGMFTPKERLEIIKPAIAGMENVVCDAYSGLAADYMHEKGIKYIVRGSRSAADFDYECELSEIMRTFDASFETVIFPCAENLRHISSTYARDLLKYGCNPAQALPEKSVPATLEIIKTKK